tara:strand:- start:1131 stop:1628 length:498 start_codon:yes stop_codon:yes gene_type:complete
MLKKVALFSENYGPSLLATAGGIAFLIWGERFFIFSIDRGFDIAPLYQSVFDTSSIVCAFLFSFLVYIKTTENTFLSSFRSKRAYKKMVRHFLISIVSSFLLTISSIPFLVAAPAPVAYANYTFWIVLVWVMFTSFVVGATVRSAYQFLAVLDAAYSDRFSQSPS